MATIYSSAISNPVWLASYPRSGNTLLRTILWQCFKLRSASWYRGEMDGRPELEKITGHLRKGPDRKIRFPENAIPLVKTHERNRDKQPAIYVIRDGREVVVSLWRFFGNKFSLEEIIRGQHHAFGTWAEHVDSWNPWERPNTLLCRYENMTGNLAGVIQDIRVFLGIEVLKGTIPNRKYVADRSGGIVTMGSDWRRTLSGDLLDMFFEINADVMTKAGYA